MKYRIKNLSEVQLALGEKVELNVLRVYSCPMPRINVTKHLLSFASHVEMIKLYFLKSSNLNLRLTSVHFEHKNNNLIVCNIAKVPLSVKKNVI